MRSIRIRLAGRLTPFIRRHPRAFVASALVASLIGWVLWAGVTYLIGAKILGGTATWGELLRTLGFAQAPGVLLALGMVPGVGWIVEVVVAIWTLITGIVAIRQALDFSTGKAILTAIVSVIILAVIRVLF